MTVRKVTKRKKPTKKLSVFDKVFLPAETHDGKVMLILQDQADRTRAYRTVTRDQALLFAVEMIVASSGLSRKEVAQHFSK